MAGYAGSCGQLAEHRLAPAQRTTAWRAYFVVALCSSRLSSTCAVTSPLWRTTSSNMATRPMRSFLLRFQERPDPQAQAPLVAGTHTLTEIGQEAEDEDERERAGGCLGGADMHGMTGTETLTKTNGEGGDTDAPSANYGVIPDDTLPRPQLGTQTMTFVGNEDADEDRDRHGFMS